MGMMIHRTKLRLLAKNANDLPKMEEPKAVEKPKIEETKVEEPKISIEDEIKTLPYFKLKSLASKYGVDVTDKKVAQIRTELIRKMTEVN